MPKRISRSCVGCSSTLGPFVKATTLPVETWEKPRRACSGEGTLRPDPSSMDLALFFQVVRKDRPELIFDLCLHFGTSGSRFPCLLQRLGRTVRLSGSAGRC